MSRTICVPGLSSWSTRYPSYIQKIKFSKYVRKEFFEQKSLLNGIAGTLTQLLGRNVSETSVKRGKLSPDQDSSSSSSQDQSSLLTMKPKPPHFLTIVRKTKIAAGGLPMFLFFLKMKLNICMYITVRNCVRTI